DYLNPFGEDAGGLCGFLPSGLRALQHVVRSHRCDGQLRAGSPTDPIPGAHTDHRGDRLGVPGHAEPGLPDRDLDIDVSLNGSDHHVYSDRRAGTDLVGNRHLSWAYPGHDVWPDSALRTHLSCRYSHVR